MKKKLFGVVAGISLIAIISLALMGTIKEEASATFSHKWALWASVGLGANPVTNKECGLWDNAPGATGTSSGRGAVLWLEADNGGGPDENEWVRFGTSQVDVDPTVGWDRLWIKFNMATGIRFKLYVKYSTLHMSPTESYTLVQHLSTIGPTYKWRTLDLALSTTLGMVRGIAIEINDWPDSIGATINICMVLIDYIQIRNASGTVIWDEQF